MGILKAEDNLQFPKRGQVLPSEPEATPGDPIWRPPSRVVVSSFSMRGCMIHFIVPMDFTGGFGLSDISVPQPPSIWSTRRHNEQFEAKIPTAGDY